MVVTYKIINKQINGKNKIKGKKNICHKIGLNINIILIQTRMIKFS